MADSKSSLNTPIVILYDLGNVMINWNLCNYLLTYIQSGTNRKRGCLLGKHRRRTFQEYTIKKTSSMVSQHKGK